MKTRSIGMLLAGIFFLGAYSSCTRDRTVMPSPCASLPDTVSFAQHIIPLFETHCSIAECHSGIAPQGNLNLEAGVAYAEVSNTMSGYIDTLNPPASLLYSSMVSVSDPMPPTGILPDCDTRLVLKWIEQKAKNN